MSAVVYFRAQAHNNAWANHRLLTACARLSHEELHADRVSFFPSIIHTLNHNLIVDRYYVSGLEGRSLGPAAADPPVPCPGLADLDREQRSVDARLIALCDALGDDDLPRVVSHVRAAHVQSERTDRTLLHLFQHQIHHRGQIHAMLAGTTAAPPQLDEFFLADPGERQLRRGDFEALGFSEEKIWAE